MIRRILRRALGYQPTTGPSRPTGMPIGTGVISATGLPEDYTPPSTSLGRPSLGSVVVLDSGQTVALGIRYGPLAPTTRITIVSPDDARQRIRDAILRKSGGSPLVAEAIAAIAVQALTGSPDA